MEKKEIKSGKQTINEVFSDWFNIPSYQRHYVWDKDNIIDLLDDISNAAQEAPNDEYFLGSYVIQNKPDGEGKDLLDGQQRLTTLFLIFATIRDLVNANETTKEACENYVFQKEDKIRRIKQRVRLLFQIRDDVSSFINDNIVAKGAISENIDTIKKMVDSTKTSPSIRNISQAIVTIQDYFKDKDENFIENFVTHLINNVVLIYVSADSLQDAFKFFSILNDRGVKLNNSDIIKSINLQACSQQEQERYAKEWEAMQIELGDEFERFLSLVRTIIIKEKAKNGLLQEFDTLVFKKEIIKPGSNFFTYIKNASKAYTTVVDGDIISSKSNFEAANLVTLMNYSFASSDWIAVMMSFMMKFGDLDDKIRLEFLKKTICKVVADTVCRETITKRIENQNNIIKAVDKYDTAEELLRDNTLFGFDHDSFKESINSDIYGKKYCKTLLFIADYILKDNSSTNWGEFNHITVEHILPQNPKDNSYWIQNFTQEQRDFHTHKIGNLCLIGRRKNTSLGNNDFSYKKEKYFANNIANFPNSTRIMSNHNEWKVEHIEANQKHITEELIYKFFEVSK